MLGQFAGEIGLVSLGVGKEFSRYSLGGMYGIVPSEYNKGPLIETITLRQTYRFYDWKRLGFYTGLNIFHALGIDYRQSQFKDSPKSYYSFSSLRAIIYLGLSVQLDRSESKFFYFESGINDIWMTSWISNPEVIRPYHHLSLALGLKKKF